MEDFAPSTSEWCNGLALVEERPLGEEDRAKLDAEARRLDRQGWLWLGGWLGPFVVITLFAIFIQLPEIVSYIWAAWAVFGFGGSICGATMAFSAKSKVRKELAAGIMKGYLWDGQSPPFAIESQVAQSLVLLEPTHRVWLMNGVRPPGKWHVLTVTSVAKTPEFAATAAQWLSPHPVGNNSEVFLGQREMSAAELAELSLFARRYFAKSLPLTLLINLWSGFTVAGFISQHRIPPEPSRQASFGLLLIITLLSDYWLFRVSVAAAKIRQDRRFGRIMIVRQPSENEREGNCPTYEILPRSRWLWTKDGFPAPWRTSGIFNARK